MQGKFIFICRLHCCENFEDKDNDVGKDINICFVCSFKTMYNVSNFVLSESFAVYFSRCFNIVIMFLLLCKLVVYNEIMQYLKNILCRYLVLENLDLMLMANSAHMYGQVLNRVDRYVFRCTLYMGQRNIGGLDSV